MIEKGLNRVVYYKYYFKSNLICVKGIGILSSKLVALTLIVPEICVFIQTNGQSDGQTDTMLFNIFCCHYVTITLNSLANIFWFLDPSIYIVLEVNR